VTASASEEALRALEETGRLDLAHVGVAARELGHIRVGLGDTEGAEQAFRRAHEYGSSPEPGMSIVRLVRGDRSAPHRDSRPRWTRSEIAD
jgi:hypothetical protein